MIIKTTNFRWWFLFGSGDRIRTCDQSVTHFPYISIRGGLYHHPSFRMRGASTENISGYSLRIVSEPSDKLSAWLLITIGFGPRRVPVLRCKSISVSILKNSYRQFTSLSFKRYRLKLQLTCVNFLMTV